MTLLPITRTLLIEIETKILRAELEKALEDHDLARYSALKENFNSLADFNNLDYWGYLVITHIENANLTQEQFINANI